MFRHAVVAVDREKALGALAVLIEEDRLAADR